MTENRILIFFLLTGTFWLQACADDISPDPVGDLESIAYDPQPYEVPVPQGFPPLTVPADNPMTVDGVQLGRFLFYDPILSKDSTMSCFSCHLPQGGFTDNLSVSFGVEGLPGKRSAMSLENVAFYNNGLFWDGRAHTLEEQALKPVEDPLELNAPWEIVEARLRRHPDYPAMFRKAFGISDSGEITRDLAAKAIAQFERILVSSGTSKFDRKFLAKEIGIDFSEAEYNGFDMFFDIEGSPLPDAQCFHCHNTPLFTTNEYFNNGLQEAATLDDFPDPGRGAITGKKIDNGKMRAPSLRNVMLTAPYMHDGRFATIEEVLDFYNQGIHFADNLDENLLPPLGLTEQMKSDLIAFLKTMTDTTFVQNPAFSNPFHP
ncbi:MAG: cytochrome C peroxidase [Lewinellaceae bacterium]|nr:cytochrome C peroxidase [Lewinellaceae bacterium]